MNFLKSFLKPLASTTAGIKLRNLANFKPVDSILPGGSFSCSDRFIWRVGGDFKTLIRFSDLPAIYYGKKDVDVLLVFFDEHGKELYRDTVTPGETVCEYVVDASRLGVSEGSGTFLLFHLFAEDDAVPVQITNRCYVGYSYKENIPSFVHGNYYAAYIRPGDSETRINNDLTFRSLRPSHYWLQKDLSQFDLTELAFVNVTDKQIWLEVNGRRNTIPAGGLVIREVADSEMAHIRSSMRMPRPIVFSYRQGFLDAHHG